MWSSVANLQNAPEYLQNFYHGRKVSKPLGNDVAQRVNKDDTLNVAPVNQDRDARDARDTKQVSRVNAKKDNIKIENVRKDNNDERSRKGFLI